MAEDLSYGQKYKEIKKRIRQVEEENDVLNIKIYKARKSIHHLKLERTFLLDRMERTSSFPVDYNSEHSDISDTVDDDTDVLHKNKQSTITSKSTKKKKDPNAPKGPGNVFFLFCRLERDKIKDEHPTENLKEVTPLLGQKWKSLSKEEKKKYYDLYKRELEDYEIAMKTYNSNSINSNILSSPTQSTEISIDYPSDPVLNQHDSPDVDSLIDDDPIPEPSSSTW